MSIAIISMWLLVFAQVYFEFRHHQGQIGPFVGVTKTTGSILFVVAGVLGMVHAQIGGTALLMGLGLSVVGDIFLVSTERRFFLLGIGTFLLAHVAYCIAFVVMDKDLLLMSAAAPLVFASGAIIARWLWPHVERKMKLPVAAYIATICTMVTLSAGVLLNGGARFATAAVIFMISDIFVARDRFVKTEFTNRLVGLPLYYCAQMIFATSAAIAHFF